MTEVTSDVQTLNPDPTVELWVVDGSEFGADILRFHNYNAGIITFQGIEYHPWPIESEGFARTSDQQPQPKLRVGNVDGSITQVCLLFDDMVGARVTRKRTFEKYLDDQPTADPYEEYPPELWFIERKGAETREAVEFELSSALDFMGIQVPQRQIIANQCPFQYRQAGCGYVGPPVANLLDQATSNPSEDNCGRRVHSCTLRQWPDGVLNFGGFAAAGLVRTQ